MARRVARRVGGSGLRVLRLRHALRSRVQDGERLRVLGACGVPIGLGRSEAVAMATAVQFVGFTFTAVLLIVFAGMVSVWAVAVASLVVVAAFVWRALKPLGGVIVVTDRRVLVLRAGSKADEIGIVKSGVMVVLDEPLRNVDRAACAGGRVVVRLTNGGRVWVRLMPGVGRRVCGVVSDAGARV